MDGKKSIVKEIIEASYGRIPFILTSLGIDVNILDRKHHACPVCGKPKLRISDPDTAEGGCDGDCKPKAWRSVIGLVAHYLKIDAQTATSKVADVIGIDDSRRGGARKRDKLSSTLIEFHPPAEQTAAPEPTEEKELVRLDQSNEKIAAFRERFIPQFCESLKPVQRIVFDAVGIELAYRNKREQFATPIHRYENGEFRIVNWATSDLDGAKRDGTRSRVLSGRNRNGLFLSKRSVQLLAKGEPAKETIVIRVEGLSDFLTLVSIAEQLDENFLIFSNSFGASDIKDAAWFRPLLEKIEPKEVWVIGDNDDRGREGVSKWAHALSGLAPIKIVQLPYELNDVRDYFNSGKTFEDFEKLAKDSMFSKIEQEEELGQEEIDIEDPLILAKNNIEYFESQFNGRLVYYRSHFYKYRNGCWSMASTDDISTDVTISINRQFEEHYQHQLEVWKAKKEDKPPKKRKFNDNILRNVMRVLKSLTKLPKAVEMPCFITDDNQRDASKTGSYIAFLNGIVDLNRFPDDGYFEPITSNWFSLATIQYNFDMSADCPRWLAFLEECLEGDRERIAILQEFAGYILEPTTKYQKMLVLEGEGGNGKSVLMAALQAMIGKHNYSSIDLEQFGERFSLAQTHGRMANFSADQDEVQQLHEGRLKQFVAGDSITFEKKNEPPFEARATAKLIVSWNNRPRIRDRSKGIWRRIIIVPFNKIVDPSKRVYGMDNPQYWEAEAPGILLWALQGLTRLRERGFTQSIESDSSLASIQAESNPVSLFFDQWVEPSESSCVKSIDLYRAYTSWAIDRNFKPLNQTHFGREVQRHFPGADKKRKRNSSSRAYIYGGVRLREQFEVDRDTEDEISAQTGRHF